MPEPRVAMAFSQIKQTLFRGLLEQANFHENLSEAYSVTAGAWEEWFRIEQQYLPSDLAPTARLTQGLCDAPDSQHALQWAGRQRALSPHLPSAYVIWARGLTAQSAIASLVFQILVQKPAVVSRMNLDEQVLMRAGANIKALWDLFASLMKALGGCLLYICIGSAGPDEFAIVKKFVKTVRGWDGPPISVTIVHPFHPGFVHGDHVTDLDGAYDVHPSLTTTDALQHVLMVELDAHGRVVSDAVATTLWETLWREVRYAVIGIALAQVAAEARRRIAGLGRKHAAAAGVAAWRAGAGEKWLGNEAAMNTVREQIQRHLDIVDLGLPSEVRVKLVSSLKLLVLVADSDRIDIRSLTKAQRDRVWGQMESKIVPATVAMFCGSMEGLLEGVLEEYCAAPCRNDMQGRSVVLRMQNNVFGWEGEWRDTFSDEGQIIVDAIFRAIVIGFEEVIAALMEEEEKEEETK
jgi:hypothetical protein